MRLLFTLLFFLMASVGFTQDPLPRASIILSGHAPDEYKEAVGTLHGAEGIKVLSHQNPVITFSYASEELRVQAMQELYTRDYNITTKSGLPVDFPMLAPNPTAEQEQAFSEQKAEWIENNPDRYDEMQENMQQNSGVTVITQEEFDAMPAEKQEHILEHPELYSVE